MMMHARVPAGEITRLSQSAEHSVRHWRTATTLGLIAIASVLGVWSHAEHWRPATYLARANDAVWRFAGGRRLPPAAENDAFGRPPVACPAAGERTMVALVFGQSQAANVVREQFVGGGHVFNYFPRPLLRGDRSAPGHGRRRG